VYELRRLLPQHTEQIVRLKDFDNPRRKAKQFDIVPFLIVQASVAALLLVLYVVVSFEVAVIAALSLIFVQVAQP